MITNTINETVLDKRKMIENASPLAADNEDSSISYEGYSSYTRLTKCIAYFLRFAAKAKKKEKVTQFQLH
jgi:hypothetical protein